MSGLHHTESLLFQPSHDIPIASGSWVGVDSKDRRDPCLVLSLVVGLALCILLGLAWA